jgi:cyclic pyranopterin phosphate synthase
LDRENFKKITGRDYLATVRDNIRLARDMGLHPVKVNAVIIRDLNDHELVPLAEFARAEGVKMRFIEFMPLDSGRAWLKELVVPGREILERLQSKLSLEPVAARNAAETARRWRFAGSEAEIGIIAPVTEPFCGHCNRIRLTADGRVRTCLFSLTEPDLRAELRRGASDGEIANWLKQVVWHKEERHHIGEEDFQQPERSMSCIGG